MIFFKLLIFFGIDWYVYTYIIEFIVFTEKETWKAIRPDYLASWTLICAFFVLVFNFVLLET